MEIVFTLDEIVAMVSPRGTRGMTSETIRGLASLNTAQPGDLSFLGNQKYKAQVASSRASVVLLPPDFAGEPKDNQMFLFVENPSSALAKICTVMEQRLWPRPAPGIHPTAVIDPSARVSPTATVGPHCVIEANASVGDQTHLQARVFIGRDVKIGNECWLMPGSTVINSCVVGNRVRLHAGVVIGSDGFGYEFANGRHNRVPQIGNVVLEDDVEVGANSTIDRARFDETRIGQGTKIDNLVQIGHNVFIGKHVIVCGQVGISGSTTIEDYVILGGQAGVAGHLTIGKAAKIAGQAGVHTDVTAGNVVRGTPALPYGLEQRINVLRQRLPDLFKRVDALEERVGK